MNKLLIFILVFSIEQCFSQDTEEHSFLQEFPKYASLDIIEFCEQGIKVADFHLIVPSAHQYTNGYWQGQRDAYTYVQNRIVYN